VQPFSLAGLPDGYVGQSASMEVGFAAAVEYRSLQTHAPTDLTLRQYVMLFRNLRALRMLCQLSRERPEGVLI